MPKHLLEVHLASRSCSRQSSSRQARITGSQDCKVGAKPLEPFGGLFKCFETWFLAIRNFDRRRLFRGWGISHHLSFQAMNGQEKPIYNQKLVGIPAPRADLTAIVLPRAVRSTSVQTEKVLSFRRGSAHISWPANESPEIVYTI
jgi:hypothetical protein